MSKGTFSSLYKKLNTAQKQAVDAIEGPVMVIAGPGTGKTQILTLRIANILRQTDTNPENILALTFTESAVFSMRRRLLDIIGPESYRVRIHTFHGFANDVITRFPDAFPRIIGSRAMTDIERIERIREIITHADLKYLRPFGDPFFYVSALLGKIGELKRENISPDAFENILKERVAAFEAIPDLYNEKGPYAGQMKGKYASERKRMEKDEELCQIYRAYEDALRTQKVYDYEDMLLEAIRALEQDKELLLTLQEEHQYILADEHQDANMSQNRLLELLASFHARPNLCIVGDEKQAIFRFQGASLENFLYFKRMFPDAITVTLTENYRSTQDILDSAHALMQTGSGAELRVPLVASAASSQGVIELAELESPAAERVYVAARIKELVDEGVNPSDIAVIYRVNRDAEGVAEELERKSVPITVVSDRNFLGDPMIRGFLTLLRGLASYGEAHSIIPLLHLSFLELPQIDVAKILSVSRSQNGWELIGDAAALKKLGVRKPAVFTALAKKLASWKGALSKKGLAQGIECIARESGFIPSIVTSEDAHEKLGYVSDLFIFAEELMVRDRDATVRDFVESLGLMEEYRLTARTPRGAKERDAVKLLTAHRAKGLEFAHVFIVHANDGKWGNRREPGYFSPLFSGSDAESLDDERRLFYVALTRAKQAIMVTYSRVSDTGSLLLPTSFLSEIDLARFTRVDTKSFEESFSPALSRLSPRMGMHVDQAFVRALFAEQGLSVTALNNYHTCPWRYFYANLLRVPQAPDKHLAFGTSVHRALKSFFDLLGAGEDVGPQGLTARFLREIESMPIPLGEIGEAKKKGEKALPGWYKEHIELFSATGIAEFRITTFLDTTLLGFSELPRLRLRGDLDRIEFLPSGRAVVWDFKTGKPKGRSQIEGKPEAWGDYKRQIVFYALLLELYDSGKHEMEEGILSFIEPDEKGRFVDAKLIPSKEEISVLRNDLLRVSEEIMTLAFADRRCEEKTCEYCALRDMMGSPKEEITEPKKKRRGKSPRG